jgi:hypothetical protein
MLAASINFGVKMFVNVELGTEGSTVTARTCSLASRRPAKYYITMKTPVLFGL